MRVWSVEGRDEVLVAVASDGAGSASCSDHGARLVCRSFSERVNDRLRLDSFETSWTSDLGRELAVAVRGELLEAADRLMVAPRELSCTFLAAVLGPKRSLFLQIGDGALVESDGLDCRPVFWPQSGEYVNTTRFLTDPQALDHLMVETSDRRIEELAILTDGLQPLALTYANRGAHPPFFRPLFGSLRREPSGFAASLVHPCVRWLRSDSVTRRTDDDLTIVLATRHSVTHGQDPGTNDQQRSACHG